MNKYKDLLRDYLQSDIWEKYVDGFWDSFYHCGKVYSTTHQFLGWFHSSVEMAWNSCNGRWIDTVMVYFKRMNENNLWASTQNNNLMMFFYDSCDCPDKLWELKGEEIIEYFLEHCTDETNKFFYFFAVANGMSDKQINQIVDIKNRKQIGRVFNFFLCYQSTQEFDENLQPLMKHDIGVYAINGTFQSLPSVNSQASVVLTTTELKKRHTVYAIVDEKGKIRVLRSKYFFVCGTK